MCQPLGPMLKLIREVKDLSELCEFIANIKKVELTTLERPLNIIEGTGKVAGIQFFAKTAFAGRKDQRALRGASKNVSIDYWGARQRVVDEYAPLEPWYRRLNNGNGHTKEVFGEIAIIQGPNREFQITRHHKVGSSKIVTVNTAYFKSIEKFRKESPAGKGADPSYHDQKLCHYWTGNSDDIPPLCRFVLREL